MAEEKKSVEEIDKLLYEHLKEIKTPGTAAYNKKKELDFLNKYYANLEPLPADSIYHNQIASFLIEDLSLSTEEADEYLTKLVDKQFEIPNANKTGISIKEFQKIKNIKDTPTNVKNVKNLTDQQLYDEFVKYSKITLEAEKSGDLTPELLKILQTQDWETFSRARGYTEQEISDFKRYLDLSAEMESRFPAKDGFGSLAEGINYELQHEDSITTLEEWKKFTSTNVVDNNRLLWGSEEFIDVILADMRASADLFDFDMGGDLEAIRKSQPKIAKQIEQGKINIANHIDAIELMKETLDRTDLPPGMSKYEASDMLLMLIESAQSKHRETNPDIPILGITDTQSQDPEFKKILTQQFADTPTTTGPPKLETRIKVSTQNPEDFGVPGNVEDYKEIEGWADDVIKPNKIFNPDAMTRIESSTIGQRYIWNDTTEFKPSEMYSRIITNNATDEDITRFFIYLATHSEQPAYAMKTFKQADALADIVKIGIFSDRPITDIIPIGVHLQETIFIGNLRNSNSQIGDEINKVLVDLVLERGQFTNLRETMRNVILEAHNDIYRQNPNDYFVLWRGGDLHRFHPWQSFTKQPSAAQDIANQMDMVYGAGTEVKSYIINKNNMIDLDALGLSFNNENEIIVLTEAANKPNATVVNIQTPEDLQNAYRTFQKNVANNDFPKQGFDIQNISKPLADAGQESQEFFSDVIKGMDDRYRPRQAYNSIIELNHPDLQSTIDIYNKNVLNGGDFNQHIFTSIPTFYETQIVKAKALENMLRNVIDPTAPDIRILDIGATEGVWAKTLTTEYPQVFVNIIEPNPAAKEIFEKEFSDRVLFTQEAFSHYEQDKTRFFSETGKPIKYFTPSENFKYDVVHESMTFQFIDSDRKGQVEYIKNNILKEDGILFIEEKFFSDDAVYKANEELKDKFKLQYYTPEQLETKAIEVLHGMGTKQIPVKDMENILNNNFKYVEQYWDAGNFKGYIASDNELATQFVPEIKKLRTSLTNHIYSTAPTEQEIKASIQKQVQDRGVNKELSKQLTKELTEKNKEFIGKASDAVQTIFKNVKSVGGVGLALGLKGLSKAAPVLEPGDVLIEKAIEKFSPQLNKAAQKLGFASLPVDKILPVYVALEINIAAAEAVQAAMYAYNETAKKKKGGYIYEYKLIDGKTRYVPVRDEDGEPIFQPAFNTYDFYNTPAGQEVAKEFDFGSNFLRQLEQERVSRYSPGWNLSKAIFGLFGTMGDAQANISEQTRGNMGQALLTGIGK